jgi:hypothetical protein
MGIPPLTAYAHWRPWTLTDRAQFRPGPPPALTSSEYARDFNEVKTVGAFQSSARTPDQTVEALFYITPAPRIHGPFAHELAARRGLDITDSSRLFALLSLALLDSQIACWEAKLTYAQWRPLTAIREADSDGNPATVGDPYWIPRVPTPPFPDYPAAHRVPPARPLKSSHDTFGAASRSRFEAQGRESHQAVVRHANTRTSRPSPRASPMHASGRAFTSEPRRSSARKLDRRSVDG